MTKKAVTIRLEEELEKEVREIGNIIEAHTPGAEANFATISRFAIEDYIKRYKARCTKSSIQLEIPVNNLNKEQLEEIYSNLKNIVHVINNKDIDQTMTKEEEAFLQMSYTNIDNVMKHNLYKVSNLED